MDSNPAVERTPSPVEPVSQAPVYVVGVDGSSTSWDAFAWAAGAAGRSFGKLVVVYVMPFVSPVVAYGVPYDYAGAETIREEAAGEIRREAERRALEIGVTMSFVSTYGDARKSLPEVARAVHATVIVVGKSTKLWHYFTGSLGHRLTCRKDAPVVVVVP
jgi:nucleotide-binding universal stress UspA family protein